MTTGGSSQRLSMSALNALNAATSPRMRPGWSVSNDKVHEAHPVGEPERGVVETLRLLLGELLVDGLDERDVLVRAIRLDLVADHRAAHV